jgi:methyl-accepting chemotaxis protein
VVADEVRKLAEKSSKSADEIEAVTRLLETNTAAVEQAINDGNTRLAAGVELSNAVAEKLSATIVASDAVTRSVRSMAESVRQQNSAIADVSSKTETLARQSEENAAAVQQIQGNADQMQQFSQFLKQSMDSFTLGTSR